MLTTVEHKIGQGAFGTVFRALARDIKNTEPATVVAVKMAKGKPNCLKTTSV